MTGLDAFNVACGVVTVVGFGWGIYQTLKVEKIEKRNYNDALNTATTAQRALGHIDEAQKAFRAIPNDLARQLDPKLGEKLAQAQAMVTDVIVHCGDTLAVTHRKQIDKNYQHLRDQDAIHGHLLRAIDAKRPQAAPVTPPVRIVSPVHGKKVNLTETVKVKSRSSNPIRLFVFNDNVWHAQKAPTQGRNGEWEGVCYFGTQQSRPGSMYKLVAVATTLETAGQVRVLPNGIASEEVTVERV